MTNLEEMSRFLSLQPNRISKHLEVVNKEELGPLLHVSTNRDIRKFTPFVTQRTGNNENRSVPRISTAPTLLGCLIGYVAALYDFEDSSYEKGYRGGWYIYEIPYELALKPSPNLLYDQANSDEHWLVTYSKSTRDYPAHLKGKFFYKGVQWTSRSGQRPFREMTMFVETFEDSVRFGKQQVLGKGFWEIKGPEPSQNTEFWHEDHLYSVKRLSQVEYNAVKKISADMLFMLKPVSLKW